MSAAAWVMNRRSLFRYGAAAGAVVFGPALLAACGTDGAAGAESSAATAAGTSAAGAGDATSTGQSQRGGTLTIGADADPIGLDPHTTTAFSSYDFIALLFNGLLKWSPKMEIEPDLAASYETPDDTTYIFKLRDDVKFHNGQALTADDVKYTFDFIFDEKNASSHASIYATVKKVTVVDELTVKFELKTPDAAFLAYLASPAIGSIVPKGVAGQDTKPVGSGPFKFDSYTPNQKFTLTTFDSYFEKDLPLLDTVVFTFFKDQSSITSALRSKAIDMTWLKDPKVAAQIVKSAPELVSAPGQTSRTFPIWINQSKAPFDDVQVRRALSLATDRNVCVQTVLAGSGKVGAMIPESQVGGYDGTTELPYYQRDVAQAKKLLADAGHPDGIDLGDYIVVAANDLDVQCSQILQQQWAEAGITVALKPIETAPLLEMWSSGDYGLLSVALSWSPDPDAICDRLRSTSTYGKAMGQTDTAYDELADKARAELDNTKRAALYQDLQKMVADQVYCLQIYQYPLRWEMWWNYIHDYVALPANSRTYVRSTWRDQ
ncbi:ABC transporter substrate-binding protein [Nakamurella lactea]|uniref:ABC transporter substrate-binding protein n=1 Tax=Nakamurella lactea TaxID=459515 RepID=UPI00040152F0|nr:ABC transporter substrate-binding protein [Nakamurella lactea]